MGPYRTPKKPYWKFKKNIRVNNEFYVCPVYNEALIDNKNIVNNLTKDFKVSATEVIKEINKDTQDFSKRTFTEDKKTIEDSLEKNNKN